MDNLKIYQICQNLITYLFTLISQKKSTGSYIQIILLHIIKNTNDN